MSEKRKNITIGILIFLCFVLLAVIVYLSIIYKAKQDEAIEYYKRQLSSIESQSTQQIQKETIPE